eukprot:g75981.t1
MIQTFLLEPSLTRSRKANCQSIWIMNAGASVLAALAIMGVFNNLLMISFLRGHKKTRHLSMMVLLVGQMSVELLTSVVLATHFILIHVSHTYLENVIGCLAESLLLTLCVLTSLIHLATISYYRMQYIVRAATPRRFKMTVSQAWRTSGLRWLAGLALAIYINTVQPPLAVLPAFLCAPNLSKPVVGLPIMITLIVSLLTLVVSSRRIYVFLHTISEATAFLRRNGPGSSSPGDQSGGNTNALVGVGMLNPPREQSKAANSQNPCAWTYCQAFLQAFLLPLVRAYCQTCLPQTGTGLTTPDGDSHPVIRHVISISSNISTSPLTNAATPSPSLPDPNQVAEPAKKTKGKKATIPRFMAGPVGSHSTSTVVKSAGRSLLALVFLFLLTCFAPSAAALITELAKGDATTELLALIALFGRVFFCFLSPALMGLSKKPMRNQFKSWTWLPKRCARRARHCCFRDSHAKPDSDKSGASPSVGSPKASTAGAVATMDDESRRKKQQSVQQGNVRVGHQGSGFVHLDVSKQEKEKEEDEDKEGAESSKTGLDPSMPHMTRIINQRQDQLVISEVEDLPSFDDFYPRPRAVPRCRRV